MATLQKFKFLATRCAKGPVIHLRRRKTLRMLLGRGGRRNDEERSPGKASVRVSHKLKDLFVSSPPSFSERASDDDGERWLPAGGGGARLVSATLRQRLLRRAWQPVLVAIPE